MAASKPAGPTCSSLQVMCVDDGTTNRLPTPTPHPVMATVSPVSNWTVRERLLEAARRAAPKLPAEARQQFLSLFSPASIGITGAVLAFWAASHAYGGGEVFDACMLVVGVATLGTAAFGVARDLAAFVSLAARAKSEQDLDAAATHLARAVVTIGVAAFLAMIMKAGRRFGGRAAPAVEAEIDYDLLTEEMLQRFFGSTKNVGELPRQNMRTIVEFFQENQVEGCDHKEWAKLITGMDLHATEPIEVVEFKTGDLFAEYVDTNRPANRQIGNWMVRVRGNNPVIPTTRLGISDAGRVAKVFRLKQPRQILVSRNASVADSFTTGGPKLDKAFVMENGRWVAKPAEFAAGGGTQYFLPDAWKWLTEVPGTAAP
jgi:hypothetical protein